MKPFKCVESLYWISGLLSVLILLAMTTHGNLTASYLWQPGELARRMLGDRPSSVPPTRELWPPINAPRIPITISTLQVAYLQEEPPPRRAATLPSQQYAPESPPIGYVSYQPRFCTVGTNTDAPPGIIDKLRSIFSKTKTHEAQIGAGRLTAVIEETTLEPKEDNATRKVLNGIRKAISGAKSRVVPETETVDSPKIVYDMPKPGDRMNSVFGSRDRSKWIPSRTSCSRRFQALGSWCSSKVRPRRRSPPRRQSYQPRLQITQV